MIFTSKKPVGIVSYGLRIPKERVTGAKIAKKQGKETQKIYASLGVISKSVPNSDEDTITIATAAGFEAIQRLEGLVGNRGGLVGAVKKQIGAIFIGSESHPYAVKPSGTVVAQALGIASDSFIENEGFVSDNSSNLVKPLALADLQFACKAGTQALQISALYVLSGFSDYALAIGADTAQAKSGDVLEYTASAGGAAFILGSESSGKKENRLLARLLATTSVATDTPDFWRRPQQEHPEHAGRFTAEPGYFKHIFLSVSQILQETGLKISDIDYFVFHTPNEKFPTAFAKKMEIPLEKLEPSLLVKTIGNTYAGASMLGLANALEVAKENKKILVASYGSGSGSDAFIFETTKQLVLARKSWQKKS